LHAVQEALGLPLAAKDNTDLRFAEELDSMGLVEFLAGVADDCGTSVEWIEEVAGRRFTTVAELADALTAAGTCPNAAEATTEVPEQPLGVSLADRRRPGELYLGSVSVRLPRMVQPAAALSALLCRPADWLEKRASIRQRHVWAEEDPLAAAAEAGHEALDRSEVSDSSVDALLVTSEAPPVGVGLGPAVHHRLGLRAGTVALEIGGACTGFLAALWTARRLVAEGGLVLVVAVEAPSRWLSIGPGPAGETAALFGDGVAACVFATSPFGPAPTAFRDVFLGADGSQGHLLQCQPRLDDCPTVRMNGAALATRAVHRMAHSVRALCAREKLEVADLQAVVAHGGNGRLPALLRRRLGLPAEAIWSESSRTCNLGSASLPVAWAARPHVPGPEAWVAVGAGLTWGAALSLPAPAKALFS
jgi:3-oxoacyl-[acyl-carrier-protein] synthase III